MTAATTAVNDDISTELGLVAAAAKKVMQTVRRRLGPELEGLNPEIAAVGRLAAEADAAWNSVERMNARRRPGEHVDR